MNLADTRLVGVFLELLFYGVYITVFFKHANILYRRRNTSIGFAYHAGTSIIMVLAITLHIVVNFQESMVIYTSKMDVPNAPLAFLKQSRAIQSKLRTWMFNGIVWTSDLFLVYRTHKVWNGQYLIVCLPFALWITSVALSIWAAVALNEAFDNAKFASLQVALRSQWFLIATLVQNIICTLLIAVKLWRLNAKVQRHRAGGSVYGRVITVIIESAALYSAILIAMIATELKGSLVFFVFLHALPPITGVVFSTILVSSSSSEQPSANAESTLQFNSDRYANRSGGTTAVTRSVGPNEGVQIELHTSRTTKTDPMDRSFMDYSKEEAMV